MSTHRSLAALLCAAALASCGNDAVQKLPVALRPGASIKFFNFGVNAPAVNFYANDTKMTAIFSGTETESTNGVAYGGVGNGGAYSAMPPGQYTLTGRIAASTDKDLPIASLTTTIADGKHYSYFMSGFYDDAAKTVDGFIVEDGFVPEFDYSTAFVRFVNAIANADPMTLYAKNTDPTAPVDSVAVGGAVAYKEAGPFTAVPNGVYDLTTRYAGSDTSVITRTAVSFVAGRVYTIGARGDITATTAPGQPFLDNTANR